MRYPINPLRSDGSPYTPSIFHLRLATLDAKLAQQKLRKEYMTDAKSRIDAKRKKREAAIKRLDTNLGTFWDPVLEPMDEEVARAARRASDAVRRHPEGTADPLLTWYLGTVRAYKRMLKHAGRQFERTPRQLADYLNRNPHVTYPASPAPLMGFPDTPALRLTAPVLNEGRHWVDWVPEDIRQTVVTLSQLQYLPDSPVPNPNLSYKGTAAGRLRLAADPTRHFFTHPATHPDRPEHQRLLTPQWLRQHTRLLQRIDTAIERAVRMGDETSHAKLKRIRAETADLPTTHPGAPLRRRLL